MKKRIQTKIPDPVQFEFGTRWDTEILPILDSPEVKIALNEIMAEYGEIAEMAYPDPQRRREEMIKAHLNLKNLAWLRKTFYGDTLANLMFAIARTLYPKMHLRIYSRNEDAIVTNSGSTLVFDIVHYDTLSALGSLALCAAERGLSSHKGMVEAIEFIKKRTEKEIDVVQKMRNHLAGVDSK
jgi:hypothetical protein